MHAVHVRENIHYHSTTLYGTLHIQHEKEFLRLQPSITTKTRVHLYGIERCYRKHLDTQKMTKFSTQNRSRAFVREEFHRVGVEQS